ncbi:MAG TPA: flagellar hook-associated protein FlgK, partial [Crenotrichaceae bacterium]|nr:flagellar hook-associated protein FlgK [Crenotrichaceae bacterium]
MAGVGMFGIGLAGLNSNRRALDITSNNIANVNTEGYSRQRANFSLEGGLPQVEVRRSYDSFISNQVRSNTSSTGYLRSFSELSGQVDNSLSDAQGGIMPGMQRFFNAIQTLSNDPASPTARQSLLSEAETLSGNFNSLGQRLDQLNSSLNGKLNTLTGKINSLSSGIADINQRIFQTQASGLSESSNLLDQRDQMIQDLSELTSVTTVVQDDGAMNVFIGSGQAVVAGFDSFNLSTERNGFDPSRMEVMIDAAGGKVDISDLMKGSGEIGGVLDFRSQVLDETRNTLGMMAMGVTAAFNEQNRAGIDLNGQAGGDFFKPINQSSVTTLTHVNNRGSAIIDASISDPNQLTGSDYSLERTTEGYQLTRMSDQQVTKLDQFPTNPETVDGVEFSLDSGGMAEGDRILIQPTRNAATTMGVAITNVNDIAAAAPLVSAAAFENRGSGIAGDAIISDSATFVAGNYTVQMATNSGAVADAGATRGTIVDNGNNSDLQYELKINDIPVYIQNET